MIFETHILGNPIATYVKSIFYYKDFKPDHSIERVVPTGHIFIIFDLAGLEYHTFDPDTLKPNGSFKKVWISGMHKNYLSISANQDSEMLVIQFKTGGSYPFLKIPIHQLNDRVIDAQELFGDMILEVREQVLRKKHVSEKFKSIEQWLTHTVDTKYVASSDTLNILSQLKSNPVREHSNIITRYPNTQKHLISQFKKYFGLTPKVFHRIFRFNEILKQLQNKECLKWAQLAYEFGYSDQSHFIKEFKEFSGFNPQEFINSNYHNDEETNFFPLD